MTPTWAVVPTKGKPDFVRELLATLVGQVTAAVVVDNNESRDEFTVPGLPVQNLHWPGYPPNLSLLYNIGIAYVENEMELLHMGEWNVALLNDDVLCPPGWVESLDAAMRATTAVIAYVDRVNRGVPILFTTPPTSPYDAATYWACLARGEAGLRYDEDFKWWYGDTDWDFRARRSGGVLAVPGVMPEHRTPSQSLADPVLAEQTHRDRETFARKWAGVPW